MDKKRKDWDKLQKEFELYKLKNRDKTLTDFCDMKGLSYLSTAHHIKVKNIYKKTQVYDAIKNETFNEVLKKKPKMKAKKRL
jgi:hypothetical protein